MNTAQRYGVANGPKRTPTVVLEHPETPHELAELLVAHQVISERQLELAVDHHRKTGLRLGDALLELRFLSEAELVPLLEWLFLAEQRRSETTPPALSELGALQRVSVAVRQTMARWRGGWVREVVTLPLDLSSKARP